MIIWKGHGILVPVFAILGYLLTLSLSPVIQFATHMEDMTGLNRVLPFWGAAVGVWFYALFMGRTTEETVDDPATQLPVEVQRSHSFLFIPPVGWAALFSVLAVFSTVRFLSSPQGKNLLAAGESSSSAEGKPAFDAANKLLISGKGATFLGNNKDAETLAADFSVLLKNQQKANPEESMKHQFNFSDDKCITYCQVNSFSCAFILQVPDLQTFAKESRAFLADMAWTAALQAANRLSPKPKLVAIGLKDTLKYDTVIVGRPVRERVDALAGIEQRYTANSPQSYLYAFFESSSDGSPLPKLKPMIVKEEKNEAPVKTASTTPSPPAESAAPQLEGKAVLKRALEILSSSKAGDFAGNDQYATALAENLSQVSSALIASTEPDGAARKAFLQQSSYCQLRDDTAGFLLRVPGFDGLDEPQRKIILRAILGIVPPDANMLQPKPSRFAICIVSDLGVSLLMVAKPNPNKQDDWLFEKAILGDAATDRLTAFFEPEGGATIKVSSILAVPPPERAAQMLAALPNYETQMEKEAAPPKASASSSASAVKLPTPVREWKSADGRIMKASLLRFVDDKSAEFKREDGAAYIVALDKLSAADQIELRKMAQALKR